MGGVNWARENKSKKGRENEKGYCEKSSWGPSTEK